MEKRIKKCGIYKITSPSGKIYIGQSVDIDKRWSKYQWKQCKGQVKLYNSFIKYGVENHSFEILEKCSIEELNNKEEFYIKQYNCFNSEIALNLKSGGNRSVFSEESKQKLKGKKHTDEAKEKIRLSKTNNSNKGYKWSDEKTESLRKAKAVKKLPNNNLPVGVYKIKKGFISKITILRKQYYLGFYNTPEEASLKYQKALLNYRQNNLLPK